MEIKTEPGSAPSVGQAEGGGYKEGGG